MDTSTYAAPLKTMNDYFSDHYNGIEELVSDAETEFAEAQNKFEALGDGGMKKRDILAKESARKEVEAAREALKRCKEQRKNYIRDNIQEATSVCNTFIHAYDDIAGEQFKEINASIKEHATALISLLQQKRDLAHEVGMNTFGYTGEYNAYTNTIANSRYHEVSDNVDRQLNQCTKGYHPITEEY